MSCYSTLNFVLHTVYEFSSVTWVTFNHVIHVIGEGGATGSLGKLIVSSSDVIAGVI